MTHFEYKLFDREIMDAIIQIKKSLRDIHSLVKNAPGALLVDRSAEISSIERMVFSLSENVLRDASENFQRRKNAAG